MKMKPHLDRLRRVRIDTGGEAVFGWEAKDPALRMLGRWTDPTGLLKRIYEHEHPETVQDEAPGRHWQATWRGQFAPAGRKRARKAA